MRYLKRPVRRCIKEGVNETSRELTLDNVGFAVDTAHTNLRRATRIFNGIIDSNIQTNLKTSDVNYIRKQLTDAMYAVQSVLDVLDY